MTHPNFALLIRCKFNTSSSCVVVGSPSGSFAGLAEKICISQSGMRVLSCLTPRKVNISCVVRSLFPVLQSNNEVQWVQQNFRITLINLSEEKNIKICVLSVCLFS